MSDKMSNRKPDTVRLESSSGYRDIPADDIYFAFPDGGITYDCVECNGTCCRGNGYSLNRSNELAVHIQNNPTIHLFAQYDLGQTTEANISIANFLPSCFFLTDSGLCRIHTEQGPTNKPETCRLFPFNNLLALDDYLIVTPHPKLCPLKACSSDKRDDKSRHDLLLKEMMRSGVSAGVAHCVSPRDLNGSSVIAIEKAVLQLSEKSRVGTSYEEFTAMQIAETTLRIQGGSASSGDTIKRNAQHLAGDFLQRSLRILDVGSSAVDLEDPALTRTMIAATPFLRALLVFNNPSGSLRNVEEAADLMRVPYILLGTFLMAALAKSAGMGVITIQTLADVMRKYFPLLVTLSNADAVMVWKRGKVLPLAPTGWNQGDIQSIKTAKALRARSQEKNRLTLEQIVTEHCIFEGVDRSRFLLLISSRLAGALAPLKSSDNGKAGWNATAGSMIQRLAMNVLDEQTFLDILGRAGRKEKTRLSS